MKHAPLIGVLVGALLAMTFHNCNHHQAVLTLTAPEKPTAEAALMALPAYDTLNEAGIAAIKRAYKCSEYYECGGAIAKRPDGKFVVGAVHTDYDGASMTGAHKVPKGRSLAGDYHTHPCLPVSHYVSVYSPEDLTDAQVHGIPAFLGDLCKGDVHVYDPHSMPAETILLEDDTWTTPGAIIGKIIVTGRSLEPDEGN